MKKGSGRAGISAWLLVQVLRRLGLAARFVSGYLVQLRADEAPLDGPVGPVADFTDLHAWAETYLPGAGWIGLDPTSGLLAGEGHIPLVCTPQPATAAPISGATEPCEVTFEFSNRVRRLGGPPRVTLPYSEEQWSAIDALGHEIDKALVTGDVRLTLGGEPTFVAADDMEDAQWTTAADGADKRSRAEALARRLLERFGPGGLIHHGQGKWYPGERLPRWQIALLWRADGEPLWDEPALLADPVLAAELQTGAANGADALARGAAVLANTIAESLGLPEGCCVPAYEDPLHRLLAEARLPGGEPPATDITPTDKSLGSSEGRVAELAALDEQGRGGPAGWVIPLHPVNDDEAGPGAGQEPAWATTRWTLRRGYLALVPGDSPLGLRLPLDALTWRPPPEDDPEVSPFDDLPPLAGRKARRRRKVKEVKPEDVPRGALCVEARQGSLFVFLPPVNRLEQFVELVGVVEGAAAKLAWPVVLEGYLPPFDPRLVRLLVTPDPGVLEVNIHPASSWPELVDITTGVHADARATRLGTEKFHLDGTHTGTGGGNHLTLGGPTPADSPLLRRPDLLRSIITYWQHHPSLSYLFSGRFIGPTSQAPRVDEARHESLYELEIAFAELDRQTALAKGGRVSPWLVDRLFRHLLVDITGSTHRAELCIDKLFSPDSERGRLGLLELRGFEMPPHPRMALVQALLVRALVARFWAVPYAGALGALGDRTPRPVPPSLVRGRRHYRGGRRSCRARFQFRRLLAGAVPRVPLPAHWRGRGRWRDPRTSLRHRTVVCPRGGGELHGHRSLCRLICRASPGKRRRAYRRPPPRDVQQRPRPAAHHRHSRCLRRRGALSGVEAAVRPAPHHWCARPPCLRHSRPVERALARRVHLPREPPWRPRVRAVPRKRQ